MSIDNCDSMSYNGYTLHCVDEYWRFYYDYAEERMIIDKVIQNMFSIVKEIKWRICEEDSNFQWYYAEDNHYVFNDKRTNAMWLVKAKSPVKAYEYVKGKFCNDN